MFTGICTFRNFTEFFRPQDRCIEITLHCLKVSLQNSRHSLILFSSELGNRVTQKTAIG